MTEDEARARVEQLTGLYIHAAVFAVVLAALVIVDANSPGGWWVQWVALGWGAGVLLHALIVGSGQSVSLQDWQNRKVEQLMQREKKRQRKRDNKD